MGLFKWWRQRREAKQLRELQQNLDPQLWQQALGDWPFYQHSTPAARTRLHELALRLLLRKHLHATEGVELTDALRLRVAGMAVAPVLELGLDWYAGWQTLIFYDGPFRARHQWRDEAGVVHEGERQLSGEAWLRGPVVLSLDDVRHSGRADGFNVVIHELAHTLDMRSSSANGAPPLHRGMSQADWARDMQAAWDDLGQRFERNEPLPLDPYALEAPAEFFAVLSESFFERPAVLRREWPAVYRHLADFYRQDPVKILG